MSEKHISTTALARLLHKESKELFVLLAQGGWMVKVDNHWQLTEKGKFEGGIYINHPKYGEYIAWPESVQDHPLLKLLPEAPLGATHLGNKIDLPARLVNLLLFERGWIKKALRGWLLTSRGKALGGEQHVSDQSGIPYVTWPEAMQDNTLFLKSVAHIKGSGFSLSQKALSGRLMKNTMTFIVENWLYLAGVIHACDYELSAGDEIIYADFFLPELQVAIDVWGDEESAAALAKKLEKQDFYKKNSYEYIEIHNTSVLQLDEFLAKQLLMAGTAVY